MRSEIEGEELHLETVPGKNGYLYCIPFHARKVAKFNPVDKSMTDIGPDFGDDYINWWGRGAITDSSAIYCPPVIFDRGILKIDTNTDTVTELDANLLPEHCKRESCAVALDGCNYFMPHDTRCIMTKLDPNNNDSMSSVGDDLGEDGPNKYSGTVIGIDGCVYGIPNYSKRIVKYDPINDTTSFVGEAVNRGYMCNGSGALGRDGCIYAFNQFGRVLKINTTNNYHSFVGNWVESNHDQRGWTDAILGIDGCIYSPPYNAHRILKYDPHSDQTSLVGGADFRSYSYFKWYGGSLASDGVIYCFPRYARRILSIDPWKEYTLSLESNMVQHPEQLGCLFQPSFDRAVTKFGYKKVMGVLEACMPPADRLCAVSNFHPFMIAASYKKSDMSVIYQLFRKSPYLVDCIGNTSSYDRDGSKKRKRLTKP